LDPGKDHLDKINLYNEKELLLQISEGDEKAFETFFFYYFPQIQPLIANIIDSQTASKDVIQDIFLNIWINRAKLPELQNMRSWIFTVAYHQSYSWLRKQKNRNNAMAAMEGIHTENPTADYTAFRETEKLIQEAVQHRLTKQQQKIYRLSREQHLTIPEIAAQLGLSPNTIKNTLVSALKEIRSYLQDHGILLPSTLLMIAFC
jgi:RNA polymerase sigma-70 factor (ECF subfamily)